MNFSFIHCADIHLDSPLKGLGAYSQDLSDCFRNASRQAFVNMVDAAIDHKVEFIIIAGDIFDGNWKDYKTGLFFGKEMARLKKAGIAVYAVSGNHDAETEITKSLPYPDNVHFFSTSKPETIIDAKTGIALHGQGFAERWSSDNIALKYPSPRPGCVNIGILHTACEGSSDHANYAPCSLEQLSHHGYHYWALGHVHSHAILSKDPYIIFPGNMQGRHVRECGPKGYCLVRGTGGEISHVEFHCCDVARWYDLVINVPDDCFELPNLYELIHQEVHSATTDAEGKPLAIRLTLQGATTLHLTLIADQSRLRAEIESILHNVSDEIMLEKLRVKTTDLSTTRFELADHKDLMADLINEMENAAKAGQVATRLGEQMIQLQTKIPNSHAILPDSDELLEIIEEAKNLVAARLAEPEGRIHEN